jgi:Methyltransferase FkbM domain
LREIGITQVDLIKIDCEGAEADVFSTLSDEVLHHCQWIVGDFTITPASRCWPVWAPHFHLDLKSLARTHNATANSPSECRLQFERRLMKSAAQSAFEEFAFLLLVLEHDSLTVKIVDPRSIAREEDIPRLKVKYISQCSKIDPT